MKMELIEGSETSAISFVTAGNYPKENILHCERCICYCLNQRNCARLLLLNMKTVGDIKSDKFH